MLLVLFLGIACLSSASPIAPTDHKLAAKMFIKTAINHFVDENYGELFDVIYGKVEHFLPGQFTDSEVKVLKSITMEKNITWKGKLRQMDVAVFTDEYRARNEDEVKRRLANMPKEAGVFLIKSSSVPLIQTNRKDVVDVKAFVNMRAEFDALSAPAKTALKENFVFFDRLDEAEALLVVAARLNDQLA